MNNSTSLELSHQLGPFQMCSRTSSIMVSNSQRVIRQLVVLAGGILRVIKPRQQSSRPPRSKWSLSQWPRRMEKRTRSRHSRWRCRWTPNRVISTGALERCRSPRRHSRMLEHIIRIYRISRTMLLPRRGSGCLCRPWGRIGGHRGRKFKQARRLICRRGRRRMLARMATSRSTKWRRPTSSRSNNSWTIR